MSKFLTVLSAKLPKGAMEEHRSDASQTADQPQHYTGNDCVTLVSLSTKGNDNTNNITANSLPSSAGDNNDNKKIRKTETGVNSNVTLTA